MIRRGSTAPTPLDPVRQRMSDGCPDDTVGRRTVKMECQRRKSETAASTACVNSAHAPAAQNLYERMVAAHLYKIASVRILGTGETSFTLPEVSTFAQPSPTSWVYVSASL